MNSWDLAVTRWVNTKGIQYAQWDEYLAHLAFSDLFKGAITIGVICWLFTRHGRDRPVEKVPEAARAPSTPGPAHQAAICSLIAFTGLALAANRILASLLPLRVRPLHSGEILFRNPTGIPTTAFSDLSAFPSDHAVMFFALSLGIFCHSGWRWIGAFLLLHATLICALRVYLGLHWLSDILGGILLAALFVYLSTRPFAIRLLGAPLARIHQRAPGFFTAVSFLTLWQFATLFQPLVALAKFLKP